ncbi:MAG: hypothetical protein LC803_15105 [Acidobacteria bacterium]|nr:hypothetical protein [Acidobacteriota bacterium]
MRAMMRAKRGPGRRASSMGSTANRTRASDCTSQAGLSLVKARPAVGAGTPGGAAGVSD